MRKLLPYKFTGKERDSETGLYYYGARYLNPRTSRWVSADPAMESYLPVAPVDDEARKQNASLPGMGGVFNLVNLAVYHYGGNNPVKYVDPTGLLSTDIQDTTTMQQVDPSNKVTLGDSSYTVNGSGCVDLATAKTINSLAGRDIVTAKDLAGQSRFFDSDGKLKVQEAVRYYTGDAKFVVGQAVNTPENPNAVRNKLTQLQASPQRYAIMGTATIQWTGKDGTTHTGSHTINLKLGNGATPGSVTITGIGTSMSDPGRTYTLDPTDRANAFQITSIMYAVVKH